MTTIEDLYYQLAQDKDNSVCCLTNSFYKKNIGRFVELLPQEEICAHTKTILINDDKIILTFDTTEQPLEWFWEVQGFPHLTINVCDFELIIKKSDDAFQFEASGNGVLANNGKELLNVTLTFNEHIIQHFWTLHARESELNNLTFIDYFTLRNNEPVRFGFPNEWDNVFNKITDKIELNLFELKFYPNRNFTPYYWLNLCVDTEINILIEKAKFKKLGFSCEFTPTSFSGQFSGQFEVICVNNQLKTVEFAVGLSTDEFWYGTIRGVGQDGKTSTLPNFIDMANWLGGFNETELTDSLKNISNDFSFDLTDIRIELNMKTKSVRLLVLDSKLKIESLIFNISTTLLPDLRVKGSLDTTHPVKIKQVLSDFGMVSPFNDNFEINKAVIDAHPKENYYSVNLGLGNVAKINLGTEIILDINEIDVQIISKESCFSSSIDAILIVKQESDDYEPESAIVFEVKSVCEDAQWNFEGGLNGNIEFTEFINWLSEKFDIHSLPQWVEDLHLKNAHVAFSTDGSYSFGLELFAPLSDEKVESRQNEKGLHISLNLDKEADKELTFNGTVNFQNTEFDILFSKDSKSSKLTAHLKSEHSLSLQIISDELGIDDTLSIPDYLNAEFNSASLEYDSGSTDSPKKLAITLEKQGEYQVEFLATQFKEKEDDSFSWLYAFKIGISKVDINLYKLPLVGEELEKIKANLSVRNIQAVLLSQAISVEKANELLNLELKQTEDKELEKLGIATLLCELHGANELVYPVRLSMGGLNSEKPKQLQLSANETQGEETKPSITWKKIGKKIGPVTFNKIGFEFKDALLKLHIDAALLAGAMQLGLDDFWLASPINKIDPSAGLNALSLSYLTDSLKISGSFEHQAENQYSGSALISFKKIAIGAFGSYAKVGNETSMFIYAMLTDPPLGGAQEFYVTVLALGFGYNRNIVLPSIDEVKQFPMVTPFLPHLTKTPIFLPSEALKELTSKKLAPIELGQQWIVAGIRFTTYKLINSFALLSVKFGNKLEFGLTGFSTISTPLNSANLLIYAELAIVARVDPQEGVATVLGKLTPESYLFSKDCKLTGGFAFSMWFGNHTNSGDFVATLGGFHPRYVVPQHYPQVPRLGFDWKVNGNLQLKGELYYALTPSCIMAGGKFEAYFQSGEFRAWFIMLADFIISWHPYYYEAHIRVNFGVSYTFKINVFVGTITKSISANFGADLLVWGPDFSGIATIDLSIISFTVRFGNAKKGANKTISWEDFKKFFLPPVLSEAKRQVQGTTNSNIETDSYLKINVTSGKKLVQQKDETSKEIQLVLLQNNIVFEISCLIPANEIRTKNFKDSTNNEVIFNSNKEVNARLTGKQIKSEIVVSLNQKSLQSSEKIINPVYFDTQEIRKSVSAATWGSAKNDSKNISSQQETLVNDLLMGVSIEAKVQNPVEGLEIEKSKLEFANTEPKQQNFKGLRKEFSNQKALIADLKNNQQRFEMLALFKENEFVAETCDISFESKRDLKFKGNIMKELIS